MGISSVAVFPADPREHEVRLLVDLVRLSRVTVMYAEDGADKSEVLKSNVLPLLQSASQKEIAVLFDSWREPPLPALMRRIQTVIETAVPDAAATAWDSTTALSSALATCEKSFGLTFIVILDRF